MVNLNTVSNNQTNIKAFYSQTPQEFCLTNNIIVDKIFSFLTDTESKKNFTSVNRDVYYALRDRVSYPETAKKTIRELAGGFYSKSRPELVDFFDGLAKKDDFVCKALVESPKLSQDIINEVFTKLAQKGSSAAFIFMQSSRLGDFSDKAVGAALYQAALHSHEEIALAILDVYVSRNIQVNQDTHWFANDGGEAFKYAAQNDLVSFVKKCISSPVFDTIGPKQAGAALTIAKRNSCKDVVDFLESSNRFIDKIKQSTISL